MKSLETPTWLVLIGLLLAACAGPRAEPAASAAAPASQAAPAAPDFSGLWQTTYGSMRLAQAGAYVAGTYSYSDGSRLEGTAEGGVLRATYFEPDGTSGRAIFELSPDGGSFNGRWRPDPARPIELADEDASHWKGAREVAVPGRTWLVILEAPWEDSLSEPQFSYGAMLRSFFSRVPDIEVRHLPFHDRADFVRACRSVAQLPGPVVLYVSSHGTPAGIECAGGTIDGRTIGEALRDVGELRLLHFGSCGVLAGDAAAQVRAAAAPHADFPISGFTVSVDWAGSAIVDFTYMSLLLEHELAPADAVRAVRSMLSFAGEGREGDAFPGADLAILP